MHLDLTPIQRSCALLLLMQPGTAQGLQLEVTYPAKNRHVASMVMQLTAVQTVIRNYMEQIISLGGHVQLNYTMA